MARRRQTDIVDAATQVTESALEGVESLLESLAPSRRRRQWSNLSTAQKKRYLSAGRTGRLNGKAGLSSRQVRDYYNRGGSLKAARGYHPPKGAASRKATLRAQGGNATPADVVDLRKWRDTAADWIPRDRALMSDDTAASLSHIGSGPKNWKKVTIYPRRAKGDYVMVVETKRGATYVTVLPDKESLREVGSLVRTHFKGFTSPEEEARLRKQWERASGESWNFEFYVVNTDEEVAPEVEERIERLSPSPALPRRAPTKRPAKGRRRR